MTFYHSYNLIKKKFSIKNQLLKYILQFNFRIYCKENEDFFCFASSSKALGSLFKKLKVKHSIVTVSFYSDEERKKELFITINYMAKWCNYQYYVNIRIIVKKKVFLV
jgi:hypothetical protein